MKKSIAYFIIIIFLWSCSESRKKPANLIPQDVMIDIFYDMNMLQTIRNNDFRLYDSHNIDPEQYIYIKYDIDSLQFVQSNKYYAMNVEEYEKMLEAVIERINAEIEEIKGSNPKEELPQKVNPNSNN